MTKKTEDVLGWCGLKYTVKFNEYDIGFRFYERYWNKGYATESAKACITYGINDLSIKEIVGRAMVENRASIRVLEKIGLIYEKDFDYDGQAGVLYKIKSETL